MKCDCRFCQSWYAALGAAQEVAGWQEVVFEPRLSVIKSTRCIARSQTWFFSYPPHLPTSKVVKGHTQLNQQLRLIVCLRTVMWTSRRPLVPLPCGDLAPVSWLGETCNEISLPRLRVEIPNMYFFFFPKWFLIFSCSLSTSSSWYWFSWLLLSQPSHSIPDKIPVAGKSRIDKYQSVWTCAA